MFNQTFSFLFTLIIATTLSVSEVRAETTPRPPSNETIAAYILTEFPDLNAYVAMSDDGTTIEVFQRNFGNFVTTLDQGENAGETLYHLLRVDHQIIRVAVPYNNDNRALNELLTRQSSKFYVPCADNVYLSIFFLR